MKKRVLRSKLNILSLGVGVQSTTLYYMSTLGIIDKFDYAIFADPGREKKKTYEYLKKLCVWGKKNKGPEIIICGKKSLYNDLLKGSNSSGHSFSSIPAYTAGSTKSYSILKRQCTEEYKIREVNKAIRKLYNVTGHQWTPPTNIHIGITTDEATRMKIPQKKWQTLMYLFCGYKSTKLQSFKIEGSALFSRLDCINWLIRNNFEVPVSSSCTFCPFQSDQSWIDTKNNDPDEFNDLIKLDKSIRDSTKRGIHQPIFLHNSLKPLDKVQFKNEGPDLFNQCNSGFCNT